MTTPNKKDWRSLAEEAAAETNSDKLIALVDTLCAALDRAEMLPIHGQSSDGHSPDRAATLR